MTTAVQTPFGANLLGSLLQNTGLNINPVTSGLVGTSNSVTSYTPGTVVTGTCLNDLTNAIQAGYNTLGVHLNLATYANLIAIGSSTIPALGNSLPPTYTWIGPANSGDTTSTSAQAVSWYPYTSTSTTNVYPSSLPTPLQWSSLTQTSYDPNITQWGWIRLFALQACYEFNWNNSPTSTAVYKDFLSSFQTVAGFLEQSNSTINALSNASTFLQNTYSNNNDLITGDITGVNLATPAFGKDLIASGKAIDLSTIDTFGLPSNLLMTLKKYNAITGSLTYAIVSSGISLSDFTSITTGTKPTMLQEQQLYGAYSIITGSDLADILIPLNCSTSGLTSLIDLLNPIKLFPNSYQSLTVPVYNSEAVSTNSKTYYRIYSNDSVNLTQLTLPGVVQSTGVVGYGTIDSGSGPQIKQLGFGAYSRGAIPEDISIATGAFSFSMQQINNIKNVPIEKFAQVVSNLETTAGLPLTAGTSVPANTTLTSGGINQMAYGSGPNGTYTMSDFFGCMTGLPYQWTDIKNTILQLQTSTLSTIYNQIYTTITTAGGNVSVAVQTLIDSANAEIASIQSKNPLLARDLNRMWNATGTQLTNEQRARDIALQPVPSPKSTALGSFPGTIVSYVNSIQNYSKQTAPNMHSQTIEAISSSCTAQGQSQIGLMRAIRNQERLSAAGITVDSTIPNTSNNLTTKILAGNGTVSIAKSGQGIPAGNATFTVPADHNVLSYSCSLNNGTNSVAPVGHFENADNSYCIPSSMNPAPVLGSIPYDARPGQDLAGPNITQVTNPITPVAGGFLPQGACSPLNLGNPMVPGSLGGSPYQNMIPPELSIPYTSGVLTTPTYTVPQAIDEVDRCNCDCWLT